MRNLLLVLLLGIAACAPAADPATLVIRNGRIVTVDDDLPEATWLAIRGSTIAAVGDSADLAPLVGPETEVLDAGGRLVIPGFIEGHGHFMGVGRMKMVLDLTKARSWNDIVQQVGEAAAEAEPGEWILGRGWHQEKWDSTPEGSVDGVPTHHSLSAVSPENPVELGHASGHATFVNAEAMRLGGISAETPDPAGGEIVRDARGEPTGLLRENAEDLVGRARATSEMNRTAEEVAQERRDQARLAAEEALSKGITSFQDAGVGFETVDLYRALADEGNLPVRLYAMLAEGNDALEQRIDEFRLDGYADQHLTVRSIKRSIDGALGSHGAWLLEPYADKPESSGLNTTDPAYIARTARIALEHGFQLNVHAIGDRANREVLDVYENAFGGPDSLDRRWRIEHAQHLHPDDIPRFARLGVIAAMQGVHATSDGPWVFAKLGEKRAREGSHVWRSLMDTGAVVTNGTDAPVEDVDPVASFYSTVSRRTRDGSLYFPDQAMTRMEALRSYTILNAYAAFEENLKGSLTPGKLADVTILSVDILSVPEEEIPSARADVTIVGGRVLYRRDPGSD